VVHNVAYPDFHAGGHLPVLVDGHFIVPASRATAHLREHHPEASLDDKLPGGGKQLEVSVRGARGGKERFG
jgi:hypothetical protein